MIGIFQNSFISINGSSIFSSEIKSVLNRVKGLENDKNVDKSRKNEGREKNEKKNWW